MKSWLRHLGIRAGLEAVNLIPSRLQTGPWSGRGVIFTLHHVRPQRIESFQPNALLSITPEFLNEALRTAMSCGMVPVRLEDVPKLLASNSDQRFFAVTLDDGYRNNAEFAAPVFRRNNVPYTIFVTSGFVERTRILWWEVAERILQKSELLNFDFGQGMTVHDASTISRKAALVSRIAAYVDVHDENAAVEQISVAARAAGIDPIAMIRELVMDADELASLATNDPLVSFGAHTLTHCNLKRVDSQRLVEEISGSVNAVQRYVGRKPQAFAYPYGWVHAAGEREARVVADAGLTVGVTTQPGVLRRGDGLADYLLPRISLNGLYQKRRFVRSLISGLPFLLR